MIDRITLDTWTVRKQADSADDEERFPPRHTDRYVLQPAREHQLRDGLEVFKRMVDTVQTRNLSLVVVLCCELRLGRKVLASPPKSVVDDERRSLTPPLIYRFQPSVEVRFWSGQFTPVMTVDVDPAMYGIERVDRVKAWYSEARLTQWIERGLDVHRSLYFKHEPSSSIPGTHHPGT